MKRVLLTCVPFLVLCLGANTMSHSATQATTEGMNQPADSWTDLDVDPGSIPLGLLFDSGIPVTNPNFTCGGCFAWSSTYFHTGTDYDLTGRRFSVPAGSFASAFRLWWAYGEEGPHPNSTNMGGGPGDFSSITLDLYDASGPGGAPGALLANLTGTWTTLDAGTYYKEFFLDSPYVFTGTDYYVSLRGETTESAYGATLLWLTCADPDPYIDFEDYFNPINGTTSGWAPYPTLAPCFEDLDFGLQIVGGGSADLVHLDPEPGCINATEPCRTVDVDFERADVSAVRGVSVTFELTDLVLCAGVSSISEGPYLSGHCGGSCTSFHVIDNMDGSYTVDCAILGTGCGPDSSGTLFQIEVGAAVPSGTGTIEITQVIVRDCVNMPVPGLAGDVATLDIDTDPPPPVSDLNTLRIKNGNGSDGLTSIQVTFTDIGAAEYEVYRAPFGDASGSAYPEYDDIGGAPPVTPTYPPTAPWTLTSVTTSGDLDEPPVRGFWYYAVFAKDECGNASAVSNIPRGRLNYHLGDVSDGVVAGQGDNLVFSPDISLIGANYGKVLVLNDPVNYLDVGPTDNGSVNGLPLTDDLVNFDDIILFAINFGQVSLTEPPPTGTLVSGGTSGSGTLVSEGAPGSADAAPSPGAFVLPGTDAAPGRPKLELVSGLDVDGVGANEVDLASSAGTYALRLSGDAALVQGAHAALGFTVGRTGDIGDGDDIGTDGTIPLRAQRRFEVLPGELAEAGDVFFASYWDASGQLVLDAVVLGQGGTFPSSGVVAWIRPTGGLRSSHDSVTPLRPYLATTSLRDTGNGELSEGEKGSPALGEETAAVARGTNSGASYDASSDAGERAASQVQGLALVGPPEPNPFQGTTTIHYRTANSAPVRLRVVDVRGRLVRDTVLEPASPGEHSFTWDGTDAGGRTVSSGPYFFELLSGSQAARGRVFFTR